MDPAAELLVKLVTAITEVDSWGILIAGCVCCIAGKQFVQERPRAYRLGRAFGFIALVAVFVVYCARQSDGAYLAYAFKAGFWAILVTGISWLALPVLVIPHRLLVEGPRERRAAQREQQRQLARERELAAERERAWEREKAAAQREAKEKERQEQQRLINRAKEEDKAAQRRAATARRSAARAACERLFALHEAEIGRRFSRATFDDFIQKYMNDDQPAEYVEKQAAELKQLILLHRVKVEPAKQVETIADATAWFAEQKRDIEHIEDEKLRRSLLAQLRAKHAEITSRLMDAVE